jgi:hypothetical protein
VPLSTAADVRLGEFALFAGSSLTIGEEAFMGMTPGAAAESGTLAPLKIGTGFSGSATFDVAPGAELSNAALFMDSSASATLLTNLDRSQFSSGTQIPYDIPLVRDASTPEASALPLIAINLPLCSGVASVTSLGGGNYGALTVSSGAEVTLGVPGVKTAYKMTSILVQTSGVLRFAGEVILQDSGNVNVESFGAIEPVDGNSTLALYLGRHITVMDAAIGLPRAVARDAGRKAMALANLSRADLVRVAPLTTSSGGLAAPRIRILNKAIALAHIHAPSSEVTIGAGEWLIGRATGDAVTVEENSAVLYDPRLDCRARFTELAGPAYSGGVPIPEVTMLFSTVVADAGAQTFQTDLKTTLETVWAGASGGHPIIKPSAAAAAAEPEVPAASEVSVDNSHAPDPRMSGKATSQTIAQHARDYED